MSDFAALPITKDSSVELNHWRIQCTIYILCELAIACLIYAFVYWFTHMKMSDQIKRQWRTKAMPWRISWHCQKWYLQWGLFDLLSLHKEEVSLHLMVGSLTLQQIYWYYKDQVEQLNYEKKRKQSKKQRKRTRFIYFLFYVTSYSQIDVSCCTGCQSMYSTFVFNHLFRQQHIQQRNLANYSISKIKNRQLSIRSLRDFRII